MSDEIRRAGDSPVGTEGEIKSEENAAPPDGLPMPRRVISAAAVLTAIVLAVLDGAIANVALPTISRVLDVTPSAAIWVVSSYQMALVIALLPCAALGESYGYRRVFTLGVVLFTLASALCALAPSLGWLIAARLLQGLGGAAIMALLAALLRLTYPRHMVGPGHWLECAGGRPVGSGGTDARARRSSPLQTGPGCLPSISRSG